MPPAGRWLRQLEPESGGWFHAHPGAHSLVRLHPSDQNRGEAPEPGTGDQGRRAAGPHRWTFWLTTDQ